MRCVLAEAVTCTPLFYCRREQCPCFHSCGSYFYLCVWHVTLCGVCRQKQWSALGPQSSRICVLAFIHMACHVVWRVQAEATSVLSCVQAEAMSVLSFVCGMSRCVACAGRSSEARSVHSQQEHILLFSSVWHVTLCGVYRQKKHPYFHVCRQKLCPYFHLCVACHVVWHAQAEAVKRARSTVEAEEKLRQEEEGKKAELQRRQTGCRSNLQGGGKAPQRGGNDKDSSDEEEEAQKRRQAAAMRKRKKPTFM